MEVWDLWRNVMKKTLNILIFAGSLLVLIISIKLFWNMGIFADEFNTSPDAVCGGEFWLYMDWLRLIVLLVVTVVSGINLLGTPKQ